MTSTTLPEPVAELVARLRNVGRDTAYDIQPIARSLIIEAADALASMQARLSAAEAKVVEARKAERDRIVAIIRKIAGRFERGSASYNNHLALALALEEERAG